MAARLALQRGRRAIEDEHRPDLWRCFSASEKVPNSLKREKKKKLKSCDDETSRRWARINQEDCLHSQGHLQVEKLADTAEEAEYVCAFDLGGGAYCYSLLML